MTVLTPLTLMPLQKKMIPAAVILDQKTLGGVWTAQGYQDEIEREKSICLGLTTPSLQLVGLGVAWVVLDEAHITLIVIDPQWQSQGLGSIILTRLLQLSVVQQDCARATLEVEQSNQVAIDLYQKFQFEILGKRPRYYGKENDAIILWRNQLQSQNYQRFLEKTLAKSQMQLQNAKMQLIERNIELRT